VELKRDLRAVSCASTEADAASRRGALAGSLFSGRMVRNIRDYTPTSLGTVFPPMSVKSVRTNPQKKLVPLFLEIAVKSNDAFRSSRTVLKITGASPLALIFAAPVAASFAALSTKGRGI